MLLLKNLKVKNCRGIRDGPDLTFKPGGLLLCGDNGTGKSSYIDAIEVTLTGRCSSLDIGVQGISWKQQGTHIQCRKHPEIQIALTDGHSDYQIGLDSNPKDLPENVQKFLEAASIFPFILRRKTLLDFIEAKPQERYKAIEAFLKLDEFKRFEANLKDLGQQCAEKNANTTRLKEENERTLRTRLNLPPQSPVDSKTCIKQANTQLTGVGISPLKSLEDIPHRLKKIEENISPLKHDEGLEEWLNLLTLLNDLQKFKIISESGWIYSESRQKLLDKQGTIKGHFYAKILEKGLDWILEDTLERCPLCNNTIDIDSVTCYVRKRIEENEEIIHLTKDQDEKKGSFLSLVKSNSVIVTKIQSQFADKLDSDSLNKLENLSTLFKAIVEHLKVASEPATIIADIKALNQLNPDEFIVQICDMIAKIRRQYSDNERYGHLYNAQTSLNAMTFHLKDIERCDIEIAHFQESFEQIQILLKYAEQARKTTVQDLMVSITEIADGYFQKIHPDETIGKPQLLITDRGTGSIILKSDFHGKEGDPRGHYSEGHIDTLGLCLFLAICRSHYQQIPELSLLILDDVLHSVDGNHRIRTAELIFQEFGDHQIIITTHDRMWFEILKTVSHSVGNNKQFQEYQIADWTLEGGPVFGDHYSDYEWLVSQEGERAQPSDRVMKAGRLLEEILQNLCDSLSISVPFRMRGDYTIDPIWSAFYSRAKSQKEFYENAKSCLDAIEILRKQRNWVGAHHNEWAKPITVAESRQFTQAVIDLREQVYCVECGKFIKKITDLDGVWSCKGTHLQYKKK